MNAQRENSESGWTKDRMAKFWRAMGSLYGQRWFRSYGEEPDPVWMSELHKLTTDQAFLAWEACKQEGEKFPPTLPHFLRLAKQAVPYYGQCNSPEVAKLHAESAARAARELPEPDEARLARMKAAPDVAKAALEEMRGLLK